MAYEAANPDVNHDRISHAADHGPLDAKTRPRAGSYVRSEEAMSDNTRPLRPRQPVNEAVTSALNTVDTNSVPPELIAHITENVIKQLKTSGIQDSATPVPQGQYPPPPFQQPVPLSPSTMSGSSPPTHHRGLYTPPSPQKHQDYHSQGSPPLHSAPFPIAPQSPIRDTPATAFPIRRTSSLSQSSNEGRKRPKGPERLSTGLEETTLEKIWGQLFDEDGHSTLRLGQFLRGLAVHIIEDYEPRHSIVITPAKIVKYYEDVRLPNELYPWSSVFDDDRSSISRMYRELSCQHHLVQERYDERPYLPGLTPVGFERWVTLLIQAHPDEEYERLTKAVLVMPINNPDEKKERFPKELSRRLFPRFSDRRVREDLESAISEHANIDLPRRSSPDDLRSNPSVGESAHSLPCQRPTVDAEPPTPTPVPMPINIERERKPYVNSNLDSARDDTNPIPIPTNYRPSVAEASYTPSGIERERQPYSGTPSESAIDDINPYPLPPPPPSGPPIERERNPYSSQPGGGRKYEDELRSREPPKARTESNASNLGRPDLMAARPSRADSSARPRPIPMSSMQRGPMENPQPEIHQYRQPSNARRKRSPSFSRVRGNDFRRSDADLRGYHPTLQSGIIPSQDDVDEDGRRSTRDRARRQAEDDGRRYGESPSSRARFDRPVVDINGPPRGAYANDEDYYRGSGRMSMSSSGYDFQQPYGGPVYR